MVSIYGRPIASTDSRARLFNRLTLRFCAGQPKLCLRYRGRARALKHFVAIAAQYHRVKRLLRSAAVGLPPRPGLSAPPPTVPSAFSRHDDWRRARFVSAEAIGAELRRLLDAIAAGIGASRATPDRRVFAVYRRRAGYDVDY